MFSISLKPKAKSTTNLVGSKPVAALGNFEDDIIDAAPTATTSKTADVNKQLTALSSSLSSKAQKKRMEAEQKVDRTVYQYDEVWDRMQDAKVKAKETKELENKQRQPKYIKSLLQSAETRRLDYLRAEEKMIQRERDAEGAEFEGTEQFVTQAYKEQMAEIRRAEAEEKAREEQARKQKVTPGMTHFYRQLLDQSEEQHSATIAAMEESDVTIGPSRLPKNLTIAKPPSLKQKSDKELAAEAIAQGKRVELNDDNQIVDRRDLLSAGLNLSAPNTRRLGGSTSRRKLAAPDEQIQVHTAVGTAATRKEINARRMRGIESQLVEEQERIQQQKARQEQEERDAVTKRRNMADDILSAKERYLQRKRLKLEQQVAEDV